MAKNKYKMISGWLLVSSSHYTYLEDRWVGYMDEITNKKFYHTIKMVVDGFGNNVSLKKIKENVVNYLNKSVDANTYYVARDRFVKEIFTFVQDYIYINKYYNKMYVHDFSPF